MLHCRPLLALISLIFQRFISSVTKIKQTNVYSIVLLMISFVKAITYCLAGHSSN